LYKLYNELDLAKYNNINRMKCAGHVVRMHNNRTAKRISDTKPEEKRGIGRPKLRWGIVWTRISDLHEREIGKVGH
jgi:hypothetical protein